MARRRFHGGEAGQRDRDVRAGRDALGLCPSASGEGRIDHDRHLEAAARKASGCPNHLAHAPRVHQLYR